MGTGGNYTPSVAAESDPIVGAINGIPKGDGAGNVSAAVENTDYQGVLTEGAFANGDKTKLDGIETGADVTDATNVGSSIHGAAAKTTPVDADTMPLIDSAASNVLKKVTWANIKATIKSYYDAVTSTLTNKTLTAASNVLGAITMTLGGDADGDIYYRSSNVLTRLAKGTARQILRMNSGATVPEWATICVPVGIAASDESTALTTGTAKATFRMPFAMTLTEVRASVTTAPTGSTLIVDINESGTTILSTKLSIDASEKTSETAASSAVISDTSLADDAEITIDIDQIGSTEAGAGLKVWLIGNKT